MIGERKVCGGGLPHKHIPPNTDIFKLVAKKKTKKRKEHTGCGILCVSILVEIRKNKKKQNGVCGSNACMHKHTMLHTHHKPFRQKYKKKRRKKKNFMKIKKARDV